MIVSNALPIQFWPVDESTYNETENCGVEYRCWCQPWQCDDEIQIQVTAEGDEDVANFSPAVIDSTGQIVHSPFTFGPTGYYFFVPSIFSLCGGQYSIVIYQVDQAVETEAADDWSNGSETPFSSKTGEHFIKTTTVNGTIYDAAIPANIPYSGPTDKPPTDITITIDISSSGGAGWLVQIEYLTALGGVIQLMGFTEGSGDGTFVRTIAVADQGNTPANVNTMRIWATIAANGATIDITMAAGQLISVAAATTHKSDCLNIQEEQECTELITYSNNKDFAGLRYEGMSPVQTFTIRVPAVFVHEEFPQEEEVHPLSNDTFIRLSGRMERKRLLDLGYMPYYMHQKMLLILMHDNIEIQGNQWKKRDAYNIEDSSKRFPKRKANVMLTDKNFIVRNLI